MVVYTLMLGIAVEVLLESGKITMTLDLVIAFLCYLLICVCFIAMTIVFRFLKMVFAVADCNLQLWLKANVHVLWVLNNAHNFIVLSSSLTFLLVAVRVAVVDEAEKAGSVVFRVAYFAGVGMVTLSGALLCGITLCAPARSAAHTGSIADSPICSPSAVAQSTKTEARRVLFDAVFEPNVKRLSHLYKNIHANTEDELVVEERHAVRHGAMIRRKDM